MRAEAFAIKEKEWSTNSVISYENDGENNAIVKLMHPLESCVIDGLYLITSKRKTPTGVKRISK